MEYLVLLGEGASNIEKFPVADVLVIDGENFTSEDLKYLRDKGVKKIYSYLNIGSIENFRDYYDDYVQYTLGEYDEWQEERWMDVSNSNWQTFILKRAELLARKGFDGYFIDNMDVYYQYPSEKIYNGLVDILVQLSNLDKDIIINGGDVFVRRYMEEEDDNPKNFDGINQEDVYTLYDFSEKKCGINSEEDRKYWQEYLEWVSQNGYDVYVLEYAATRKNIVDAKKYCRKHGWSCYVADNIELKINREDSLMLQRKN